MKHTYETELRAQIETEKAKLNSLVAAGQRFGQAGCVARIELLCRRFKAIVGFSYEAYCRLGR